MIERINKVAKMCIFFHDLNSSIEQQYLLLTHWWSRYTVYVLLAISLEFPLAPEPVPQDWLSLNMVTFHMCWVIVSYLFVAFTLTASPIRRIAVVRVQQWKDFCNSRKFIIITYFLIYILFRRNRSIEILFKESESLNSIPLYKYNEHSIV